MEDYKRGGVVAVAGSGSTSEVSPWVLVLMGVLFAGGIHAAKATTRVVVNATTGGIGAPAASAAEDTGAIALSAVAIALPILVVFVVAILLFGMWWLWHRERVRRRKAEGG